MGDKDIGSGDGLVTGGFEEEGMRLYGMLAPVGWSRAECRTIAPITLRIRKLVQQQNAIILGHSYVAPEVIYGVADVRGDSLGLSVAARDATADTIVFCGVSFMAETAAVLCPDKRVLLPAPLAGCSLSESITAADVRALRAEYPDAGVVCYVNTSASVKAECDACCTSANVLAVVEGLPQQRIVFVPDGNMGMNLRSMTTKQIIGYDGKCIVHDRLTADHVQALKDAAGPGACVMVHTESPPAVVALADVAGGTGDMMKAVKSGRWESFVVVTEDGMADRFRIEFPQYRFFGINTFCPHMKMTGLRDVLQVLESPRPDQVITVPEPVRTGAARAIDKMFELTAAGVDATKPHSNAGDRS
ncbi:MAG TPA: quinolinate synthase NadA [Myxococcota bacterium]|nr:quinolinate synthase NadA [Myxococcota bacterium]HNZ03954.1 quinolinate synthase NadA [Myxococcota bacterium]HOD08192.1 quinolinate synthase NadA [Myxococcota bacterium]